MTRRSLFAVCVGLCLLTPAIPAQEAPSSTHVTLLGTIKVKPGREEDFRKALVDLAARSRRDDKGMVRFEFYRAAPLRGEASGQQTWIELEEWENQAAASAHQKWAGPVLQTTWKELTDSFEFVRLSPIDLK